MVEARYERAQYTSRGASDKERETEKEGESKRDKVRVRERAGSI